MKRNNCERNTLIVAAHEQGETFVDIGKRIGLSAAQVRVMFHVTKRKQSLAGEWDASLSVRASNAIHNMLHLDHRGACQPYWNSPKGVRVTPQEVAALWPMLGVPNLGDKTREEIRLWLAVRGVEVEPLSYPARGAVSFSSSYAPEAD